MSDDTTRCAARADFARTTCDLPRGHVESGANWHESTVTQRNTETGETHSIEHEATEVVRWAPASFEIPRQPKAEPED